MLGQLRAEPAVDRRDQPDVLGLEADLRADGQRPVGNLDALRARLEFRQTGHLWAVQTCRVCEFSLLERGCFHHQMVLDQPYLPGVNHIAAHHHLLDASVFGHLKDVQRAGEVERHHLMTVSVDVLLRGLGPSDEQERDQGRGDDPLQREGGH